MAFPASNQNLDNAYRAIKEAALQVKTQSQTMRTAAAGPGLSADRIVFYAQFLNTTKARMATLASTPGLPAYAQTQENNGALDIAAEYNAMVAQINATMAWIGANFPEDASGYKLAFTLDANGVLTWRTFTAGSLSTFVTVLDALIATIN